jgi:hypothetical protein
LHRQGNGQAIQNGAILCDDEGMVAFLGCGVTALYTARLMAEQTKNIDFDDIRESRIS